MQDAYVAEKGDRVGGWADIGYVAPGVFIPGTPADSTGAGGTPGKSTTSNFDFVEVAVPSGVTFALTNGWAASNKTKLNDCPADNSNKWTISIAANTTIGDLGLVKYTAAVAGTGCLALTPNFTTLGEN